MLAASVDYITNSRERRFCQSLKDNVGTGNIQVETIIRELRLFDLPSKQELKEYMFDGVECSICLSLHDGDSLKTVNCGHLFHGECLKHCLLDRLPENRLLCPECNHDFIEKVDTVWKKKFSNTAKPDFDDTSINESIESFYSASIPPEAESHEQLLQSDDDSDNASRRIVPPLTGIAVCLRKTMRKMCRCWFD
jgi:hypothetical protein